GPTPPSRFGPSRTRFRVVNLLDGRRTTVFDLDAPAVEWLHIVTAPRSRLCLRHMVFGRLVPAGEADPAGAGAGGSSWPTSATGPVLPRRRAAPTDVP
ncbi:MAG TPA: hypothetical protein VFO65_02430, partial [Acidimicrobiales bacterium]|nr:hypothetical protein [Acidimicrobiales bacterium]